MTQQTNTLLLRGGLNVVTPAIAVPAGMAIAASNYVADVRGYSRVTGYERYDGRPRPSDAEYWLLDFDTGTAAISTGNTVTGLTSGATGIALQDAAVSTGSYGGGDAAGFLVLGEVTGTFVDNEALRVGGVTKSFADGAALANAADDIEDDKAYTKLAAEVRRALITAIPGSGPVRGICELEGALYAFRDNAGATACVMHKATAAGWVAQSLGSYLKFDAGSSEMFEGDAINGQTSGATATVRRVVQLSGLWTGTAAGFIVLSGIVGTFQDNENIRVGVTVKAVADGVVTANALPPGGHYDFTIHNFYGAAFTPRMYAVNGVGRGFEWDGTYFAPLFTGLADADDKPTHIAQFSNHLFLFYDSGLIQFSSIGTPTEYNTTTGAGNFTFGHPITDALEATSTSLIVLGERSVGYITGMDVDTFLLSLISEEAGAFAWTAQVVGSPIYLDDGGIRRLTTTQAFGNWRMGTISQAIEPILSRKRKQGIEAVASVRVRARDQYIIFFDDLTAVAVYFGRKDPEIMTLDLSHQAFCAATAMLTADTGESVFFGGDDGYVYEMERGRSFDGEAITAFCRLAFNSIGTPRQNKRWHKFVLECDVAIGADISISCDFAYGSPDYTPSSEEFSIAAGGGFWNEASWNEFYWSSQVVGQAVAYVDGFGQNASPVLISNEIDDEEPHTLSSLTCHFSYRGLKK